MPESLNSNVDEQLNGTISELTQKAESGDAEAQGMLGNRYYKGDGIEKDFVKAVEWLWKAVAQKNPWAMLELGRCYDMGKGVRRSSVKAVKLYQKAAEMGIFVAQFQLSLCYHFGHGVQRDPIQARMWYLKFRAHSNPSARFFLDEWHQNGGGSENVLARSTRWYQNLAEQSADWIQSSALCRKAKDGRKMTRVQVLDWW